MMERTESAGPPASKSRSGADQVLDAGLSQELVRQVAERVYAMLLTELTLEKERRRWLGQPRWRFGGGRRW